MHTEKFLRRTHQELPPHENRREIKRNKEVQPHSEFEKIPMIKLSIINLHQRVENIVMMRNRKVFCSKIRKIPKRITKIRKQTVDLRAAHHPCLHYLPIIITLNLKLPDKPPSKNRKISGLMLVLETFKRRNNLRTISLIPFLAAPKISAYKGLFQRDQLLGFRALKISKTNNYKEKNK